MDYQDAKKSQEQAFFTAGAGSTSFADNTFDSENNLDLTTKGAASWSPESPEQRQELVANKTGTMHEDVANILTDKIDTSGKLGETIDVDLPPTMQALPADPAPSTLPVFNEGLIRTDGDHIDKKALPEINSAIEKLNQTGNTADFYTTIRGDKDHPGMLGSNLKNSYNRELK